MLPDLLELRDFASRYTAARCSQNPARVAAFFSQEGSLRVNHDPPAVGRAAVTQVAQTFMTAFPDLSVVMDDLLLWGDEAEYYWTLTGTNTGPGRTGHMVHISGFEKCRIGSDGLIASSQGHFDAAEYRRQLEQDASNVALYPNFQEYFRSKQPPTIAVWGNRDPFFLPPGAEAFKRHNPGAEVRFFETGHFALETHSQEIANAIRDFLGRKLDAVDGRKKCTTQQLLLRSSLL